MTKTRLTLSDLIAESSIPATLIRAVVRQLGGWESFTESAPDIARHGIDGGFHGFIYHRDTEAFAKRNLSDIRSMAVDMADDCGTGLFDFIRGFGCFRNEELSEEEIGSALFAGKNLTDYSPNILNALAWYAGEKVARAYVDLTERE